MGGLGAAHFCEYVMNFMHIVPTPMLDTLCSEQKHFLTLAHLLQDDVKYAEWFRNHRASNPKSLIIQDNSAFEQFKRGEPMFPADRLLDLAESYNPDYIVMSDYPGEHSSKTIAAAEELAPRFKRAGYGTFFVPQSEVSDIEDYIQCVSWAVESPLVDYIGVSILGVPNAYGVEQGNKLQRFMSRWSMMHELRYRGILRRAYLNNKRIHFLGLVDGPQEVKLCSEFNINTWDSSAASWYGLNGIEFDNSPTGALNGKFEKEVDFDLYTTDNSLIAKAKNNMRKLDNLCQ